MYFLKKGLKEDVKQVELGLDAGEAAVNYESSNQSLNHVSDFLEREGEAIGSASVEAGIS